MVEQSQSMWACVSVFWKREVFYVLYLLSSFHKSYRKICFLAIYEVIMNSGDECVSCRDNGMVTVVYKSMITICVPIGRFEIVGYWSFVLLLCRCCWFLCHRDQIRSDQIRSDLFSVSHLESVSDYYLQSHFSVTTLKNHGKMYVGSELILHVLPILATTNSCKNKICSVFVGLSPIINVLQQSQLL